MGSQRLKFDCPKHDGKVASSSPVPSGELNFLLMEKFFLNSFFFSFSFALHLQNEISIRRITNHSDLLKTQDPGNRAPAGGLIKKDSNF